MSNAEQKNKVSKKITKNTSDQIQEKVIFLNINPDSKIQINLNGLKPGELTVINFNLSENKPS
jgi:hypothetical protein